MKKPLLLIAFVLVTCVGCGESSSTESENEFALQTPTNLTATRAGTTGVRLTWSDSNKNEENFLIERKQNTGPFAPRIFTVRDVTTAVDSMNLFLDNTYIYRVRAIRFSEQGPFSNEATIKLAK